MDPDLIVLKELILNPIELCLETDPTNYENYLAHKLQIVKYRDDNYGFYLFIVDKSGEEVGDFYHNTIEEAEKYANLYCGTTNDDWYWVNNL